MKAVDSEDSKNRTNDYRRLLQITKAVADPASPWAKYSTGNLQTLRDDLPPDFNVRAALLALHREHYTAEKMAVALVGPASLDALEALVREKFGPIVTKEALKAATAQTAAATAAPPAFAVEEEAVLEAAAFAGGGGGSSSTSSSSAAFRNPFPPRFMPASAPSSPLLPPKPGGLLRQGSGGASSSIAAALNAGGPEPAVPIVRVVPLRDKRELRLVWALPPVRHLYRAPPTRCVACAPVCDRQSAGNPIQRTQSTPVWP